MYKILESNEAIEDVYNIALYMLENFSNQKAADDFLTLYNRTANSLKMFPKGYDGTSIMYRGYEIHKTPFKSYCIMFVINDVLDEVVFLRVFNERQNWKSILKKKQLYHFNK